MTSRCNCGYPEGHASYCPLRVEPVAPQPSESDVRERMIENIAGGTISVPGGYGDLARGDAENIVDAILGELAAHDAEVAAKTLDRMALTLETPRFISSYNQEPPMQRMTNAEIVNALRLRAAEYRKAVEK